MDYFSVLFSDLLIIVAMPIKITKSLYGTLSNIESVEFEFRGKQCDIQVYYNDGDACEEEDDEDDGS